MRNNDAHAHPKLLETACFPQAAAIVFVLFWRARFCLWGPFFLPPCLSGPLLPLGTSAPPAAALSPSFLSNAPEEEGPALLMKVNFRRPPRTGR